MEIIKEEDYNSRPTFYYMNDKKKEIRAGGVLFYRIIDTHCDFLMMYNEWRKTMEDFGGRTSEEDKSIEDTVSREIEEESNGIFKKEDIKKRLNYSTSYNVYIKQSKYLVYFVKITKKELKLKKSDFGNLEIYDNLKRTVDWIQVEDLLEDSDIQLNPRLAHKQIYYQILNIVNYALYSNYRKKI